MEYQVEALVWTYFGDTDKGHIATAKMGMTQRIEALKTLVEWTEPDDGVAEAIDWAASCFDTVRESRNSVVHGYNFKADKSSGKLFIEKRKSGMVFDSFMQFEITPEALSQIIEEQVKLSMFIHKLQRIIDQRGLEAIGPGLPAPKEPLPLPAWCPLPQALTPLPHQRPQSARGQRKSLEATAAKAAKSRRKDAQRAAAESHDK